MRTRLKNHSSWFSFSVGLYVAVVNPTFCFSSIGLTSKGSFGSINTRFGPSSSPHVISDDFGILLGHRGSFAGAQDLAFV